MKLESLQMNQTDKNNPDKANRSDAEWQKNLTAEQYQVMRQHGTEPAFTGKYHNCKDTGTYVCAGCGQPLFSSKSKFDSGTGWPSYFQPLTQNAIGTTEDNKLGMQRVEVHCKHCDAHLGHVFPDGPQPTGLRYCINSVSLDLVQDEDKQE